MWSVYVCAVLISSTLILSGRIHKGVRFDSQGTNRSEHIGRNFCTQHLGSLVLVSPSPPSLSVPSPPSPSFPSQLCPFSPSPHRTTGTILLGMHCTRNAWRAPGTRLSRRIRNARSRLPIRGFLSTPAQVRSTAVAVAAPAAPAEELASWGVEGKVLERMVLERMDTSQGTATCSYLC